LADERVIYTSAVIGEVVVFATIKLEIATVPDATDEITVTGEVPTFLEAYEVFE
jgi:hypothetical protein